jgi:hypothetical protein
MNTSSRHQTVLALFLGSLPAKCGRNARVGLMSLFAMACFLLPPVVQAADPKPGNPGPVVEGVYTMMKISGGSLIGLGDLEVRGTTYQAAGEGGFKPFTIDGSGFITWSAGLNIMPDGWKLGKSVYTKDEKGRPLIQIYYTSPSNAAEVIDALKEK